MPGGPERVDLGCTWRAENLSGVQASQQSVQVSADRRVLSGAPKAQRRSDLSGEGREALQLEQALLEGQPTAVATETGRGEHAMTGNHDGDRAPFAPPTARDAFGRPRSWAISTYVRVAPNGIASRARHTSCWNSVPTGHSFKSKS